MYLHSHHGENFKSNIFHPYLSDILFSGPTDPSFDIYEGRLFLTNNVEAGESSRMRGSVTQLIAL
jgi:hypothetical protein